MDQRVQSDQQKYYRICVPRGHVGSGKSQEIVFYIEADDIATAVKKAMMMPGVKHSRYASNATEVTKEEYVEGRKVSAYTKYIGNLR